MISIITPILNGAEFISENILSIKSLKIPYEHIIVDGGSTDESINIIKSFDNIMLINQEEKTGMYGGIDYGFKMAKGKYICWINCDDRIINDGFERMYRFALKNDLDFVCSDGIISNIIDKRSVIVRGTRLAKYFLNNGLFPFLQPSSIYKKDLYTKVNGFNFKEYKIIGDGELFYRMARLHDSKFGYISCYSTIFLKHGNSFGDKNYENANKERIKSKMKAPSLFGRILFKAVKLLHI